MKNKLKTSKAKHENLIRSTWFETNKGSTVKTKEHGEILLAIELTKHHLKIHDKLFGTTHFNIFCELYLKRSIKTKYKSRNLFFEISRDIKINTLMLGDKLNSLEKRHGRGRITKTFIANNLPANKNTITNYTNLYIDCFKFNLIKVMGSSFMQVLKELVVQLLKFPL